MASNSTTTDPDVGAVIQHYPQGKTGKVANIIAGVLLLGVAAFLGGGLILDRTVETSTFWGLMAVGAVFGGMGVWTIYTALGLKPTSALLGERGLVKITGEEGKPQQRDVVLWGDVSEFYQHVTRHYRNGAYTHTTHVYTLLTRNGAKLIFDDKITSVEDLGNKLQNYVANTQLNSAMEAYNRGDDVRFGKLVISKDGVTYGNKKLAWGQVEGVQIQNGMVAFKKAGGWFNWADIPVYTIPNLLVFLNLVNSIVTLRTK
jgi:hypothetical protein